MPTIRLNGTALYYEEHGTGLETIVFAHGLLWSCRMFDAQVALLKEHYRCVAFDFRGQGHREVTRRGYDMETLYADAVALIEQLGCAPCHFLGLSMGGFIGLRLAARRPELLRSLILLEITADPEPRENVAKYRQLAFVARWFGLGLVVDRVMPVMFGRIFLSDPARAPQRREWRVRMSGNHRLGITRATTGVIARNGIANEIDRIRVPTLILVGDEDVAVPLVHSQRLHECIAGSRLQIIPRSGHTSTVEEPTAVNAAITSFLGSLSWTIRIEEPKIIIFTAEERLIFPGSRGKTTEGTLPGAGQPGLDHSVAVASTTILAPIISMSYVCSGLLSFLCAFLPTVSGLLEMSELR